jgi:hypothetical protein
MFSPLRGEKIFGQRWIEWGFGGRPGPPTRKFFGTKSPLGVEPCPPLHLWECICVMENEEDRDVMVGATGADEMCNFYMMYWVNGDQVLADNTCYSPGPPQYYWGSDAGLNHIPEKQADQA